MNTSRTGQDNLSHVFGADYMTQIRDWATSVFADDVAGVTDARFLEPSWNMRDIFPHLVDSNGNRLGKYPLAVVPLSDASAANLSIYSGGAAYLRFSVPANGQASIDWSNGQLPVSPFDPVHVGANEIGGRTDVLSSSEQPKRAGSRRTRGSRRFVLPTDSLSHRPSDVRVQVFSFAVS